MGFKRDRKVGDSGEERVAAVLQKLGLTCEPNRASKHSELAAWDLKFVCGGRERLVEVKHDRYEAKSGNVAIEYYNPRQGKLSGILATRSDLWVFVLADNSVWACRTDELRRYFESAPCLKDVPVAGDGNASVRLYPRVELFAQLFVRLDSSSPAQSLTTLSEMLTRDV